MNHVNTNLGSISHLVLIGLSGFSINLHLPQIFTLSAPFFYLQLYFSSEICIFQFRHFVMGSQDHPRAGWFHWEDPQGPAQWIWWLWCVTVKSCSAQSAREEACGHNPGETRCPHSPVCPLDHRVHRIPLALVKCCQPGKLAGDSEHRDFWGVGNKIPESSKRGTCY